MPPSFAWLQLKNDWAFLMTGRPPASLRLHLACIWAALLLLAACDGGGEQKAVAPPPPPPAVQVATVGSQEVTPSVTFTGRVVAIDKVDLRARVEGFLEARHFTEGQQVKTGDLLFSIEQGQYQAAVSQAEATLARAQAALGNAELQLGRANELVKNKNIPQATRDDRQAERDAAAAEVAADQAALDTAKLNLSYTEITAPISGRIGISAYSQGNLVNPASGTLATVVSQDPIYVTFPVSQRELLEVREQAEKQGGPAKFKVKLRLPDGKIYDQTGTINFVDVQVDQSTDTVTVRATFPNPQGLLVEGALVGVIVEQAQPEQRLVIPQVAVLVDQAGAYVLLVDAQSKVEQRRIVLGDAVGASTTVISGLKAGEKVIVEGLQKVRPGQAVAATEMPPVTANPS